MLPRALLLLACTGMCLCSRPWYLPSGADFEDEDESAVTVHTAAAMPEGFECEQECSTTLDCDAGLSCFHATNEESGCCLKTLKPNETGCVLDEQCKRACDSTICDLSQLPSRCLCEKGRHFLFNKCWKKCPDFAYPDPIVDESGFSRCELKTDTKTAAGYMRRYKRQLRSNFC